MIKNNFVAILYSNKNYELSFKMQKWCNDNYISFVNVVDILDLSIKITQVKPTFIFIDGTKSDINIPLFELFTKEISNQNMKIVCVVNENSNKLIIEELNKYAICMKASEIKNYLNFNSMELAILKCQETNNDIILQMPNKEDVGKILIELGFNPKLSGYQYLKKIIEEIVVRKNDILLLNQYYSAIAGIFKTNSCNIERNIRNSIKKAWKNFGKENWSHKLNINDTNKIPTNRELICYTVELVSNKQLRSCY